MAQDIPYLIINPNADSGKLGKRVDDLLNAAKEVLIDFDYRLTEQKGDGIPYTQEALDKGYKTIVAIGGDGTLNEVINVAARTDVKIGMVPGGSACDSHKTHGVPRDFHRAFEIIKEGYTEKFPLGLAKGDTIRYFSEMLNGAFIGRSSATINKIHKLVHGEFGYGLVAAYVSLFHRPIKTRVTIDDEIIRETKLGAFGICLTDVISDFEMVPGNHPKKGDFAIFFCKKLGGIRLLRLMLKAIDGKHINHKHVEILRGKKVLIESKKPHVWESEGEIPSRKATRLEVEYIPEAVNLIIPKGWKYGFTKKERQEAIQKVLHKEPFTW